jgi:hypothetical protein
VCVVLTRYENAETNSRASSVAGLNFASNLMKTQRKLKKTQNGFMESMPYRGHRFLYGEDAVSMAQVFRWHKAFWMAVRLWKTNLVLKDLARQKRKKCDQRESCRVV